MRDLFPGYYPPANDDIKAFIAEGLVVLDTNALLNIYRFTEEARTEYLDTLRILGDRLWIPHRVVYEFFENRTNVIRDCAIANDTLTAALARPFSDAWAMIDTFAKYRGLSESETESLTQILDMAATQILDRLNEIYDFSIEPDTDPSADPLLQEIEVLLEGKIGPAFDEKEAGRAANDGKRRINNNIPPGYADRSKGDDRAIGDYLLWAQTIKEAKRRQLPVLLVTNDQKEDWVHLDSDQVLGPRSELIVEMRTEAGQKFHIATVQMFLVYAKNYLSAHVSDATVNQAASARHAEAQDVDVGAIDSDVQMQGNRSPLETRLAADSSRSVRTASTSRLVAELARANPMSRLAAQLDALTSTSRLAAQLDAVTSTSRLAAEIAQSLPTSRLAAQLDAVTSTSRLAGQFTSEATAHHFSEKTDDDESNDAELEASAEE
ncbi:PIN-like domain-containing protein [Actinoallomurus acanthiterrae]